MASPGIEPGSGASEALILSIVLRGHRLIFSSPKTINIINYIYYHLNKPVTLVVNIFTAMANKTTPKNLRTAVNPPVPNKRAI